MPVSIGSQLGPYEVVAPLGKGGMGEVYRGVDTRLNRPVAIKCAHGPFSERFHGEVRAISALSHPSICTLYDVGPDYLVMELVEGDTLAARLTKGPLPLGEVLRLGTLIADALAAAHAKRVTHRDLKPANIMVTKTGVKVLDFGLAKFEGSLAETAAVTQGLVGTPAYMAPEQLAGEPADARADIFALGLVLHEMVTGTRVLVGHGQPPVLTAVPERLAHIIERCLATDPDDRWQSAGDVRRELEWAAKARTMTPGRVTGARRPWLAWSVAAALGLMLIVVGSMAVWMRDRTPTDSGVQFTIAEPEMRFPHVALSPDGQQLAIAPTFDGRGPLLLRRMDSLAFVPLRGTEAGLFPFWSPDGRSIGFFADRKLKRLDLDGEVVRVIADAPVGRGATWLSDDTIVFSPSVTSPLQRVAAAGGVAAPLTTLGPGQTDHRAPLVLPGGRRMLYYARGSAEGRGVYVANVDGSNPRRLLDATAAAVYAPPGFLLFAREQTLLAQAFDRETLALSGRAFDVAGSLTVNIGVSLASLSSSASGALVFGTSTAPRQQATWFDRNGKALGAVGPDDGVPLANPSMAPTGNYAAYSRNIGGNWDIWILDLARGTWSRLTSEPSLDFVPAWTADGTRVIFSSTRDAVGDLYSRPANGSGAEARVFTSAQAKTPTSVSSDGRFLLFDSIDGDRRSDIWLLSLIGDADARPLVQTTFDEGGAQVSPDGKWLAYTSNETGRYEVYLRPFPDGARSTLSVDGGWHARWGASSNELFYLAPDRRLMRVGLLHTGSRVTVATPEALFTTTIDPAIAGVSRPPYIVSPDGRRFLIAAPTTATVPTTLTVMTQWKGRSVTGQ